MSFTVSMTFVLWWKGIKFIKNKISLYKKDAKWEDYSKLGILFLKRLSNNLCKILVISWYTILNITYLKFLFTHIFEGKNQCSYKFFKII